MEVRIGVANSPREVVVDSPLTADEVSAAVAKAISAGESLVLNDDKGRKVIVPGASITYVDIAAAETRRVGFGS